MKNGDELKTASFKTAVPWNSLSWPKTYIVEAELTVIDMFDEADIAELSRRLKASGEKFSTALARYVHLGLAAEAETGNSVQPE